jgi:hypothetical protein
MFPALPRRGVAIAATAITALAAASGSALAGSWSDTTYTMDTVLRDAPGDAVVSDGTPAYAYGQANARLIDARSADYFYFYTGTRTFKLSLNGQSWTCAGNYGGVVSATGPNGFLATLAANPGASQGTDVYVNCTVGTKKVVVSYSYRCPRVTHVTGGVQPGGRWTLSADAACHAYAYEESGKGGKTVKQPLFGGAAVSAPFEISGSVLGTFR